MINGEAAPLHPQRLRLAGRDAGARFDRLAEAALGLARGADGTGKPLSLSQTALRKIAEAQPATLAGLDRAGGLGPARLARFGAALLAVLRDA